MKEALLYEPVEGGKVRCTACARYCRMGEGQIGLCGIRQNLEGKLQLLVYGKVISGHVDPIEKKPVIHYMPGAKIFSIATTGCNWLCSFCQNYDISQRREIKGTDITPEGVVELTLQERAQGIAYTYNQPTIFMEFAHDIGVLARQAGLINIFVSNGYDTPQTVAMMPDFLDAITVDVKGNAAPKFVRQVIGIPDPQPIFDSLIEMRDKTDVHIEITSLVVPQVGDDLEYARKLARFVYDELGPDTPIHFLRFHPDYKMVDLPHTPVETLEKHHRVAQEVGLKYVYIGNVPGHPLEHTYCPGCGRIAIQRHGFDIQGWGLDAKNRCKECGYQLPIVGDLQSTWKEFRFQPVM